MFDGIYIRFFDHVAIIKDDIPIEDISTTPIKDILHVLGTYFNHFLLVYENRILWEVAHDI